MDSTRSGEDLGQSARRLKGWETPLALQQRNRPIQENVGLGGNLMEFLLWSIIGGLVGTALMDIVGSLAEQLKITSRGS